MNKVVIISDLGTSSFELAHLKASLVSGGNQWGLHEVTHEIQPHDLMETYFYMRDLWKKYPEGSLFVIAVGVSEGKHDGYIIARTEHRSLVAPDNGILPMLLAEETKEFYQCPEKNTLEEVVSQLCVHPEVWKEWRPYAHPVIRISEKPMYDDKVIKAAIVHVDRFGNLYVNVSQQLFEQHVADAPYFIRIKRDEQISKVVAQVNDVPDGELVAFFDNTGSFLVIGINKGNAHRLLGLEKGKYIFIEKRTRL